MKGTSIGCFWKLAEWRDPIYQPSSFGWQRTSGVAKTSGKVSKSHGQCLVSIHGHLPTMGFEVATMQQDMNQDFWSRQCRRQMLLSLWCISTLHEGLCDTSPDIGPLLNKQTNKNIPSLANLNWEQKELKACHLKYISPQCPSSLPKCTVRRNWRKLMYCSHLFKFSLDTVSAEYSG